VSKKTWSFYEREVQHYFQYEPGPGTVNLDPDRSGGSREPRPLLFRPGADYWMMMTVVDRLREADKAMPYRSGKNGCPSASMVLRAAYGDNAAKYEDSAPNGQQFLAMATRVYVSAAALVPARRRPSATDRLMAQLDRILGT
jgi:hypothetical protein